MEYDIITYMFAFFFSAFMIILQVVMRYKAFVETGKYGYGTNRQCLWITPAFFNLYLVLVVNVLGSLYSLSDETYHMYMLALIYTWANMAYGSGISVEREIAFFEKMKDVMVAK